MTFILQSMHKLAGGQTVALVLLAAANIAGASPASSAQAPLPHGEQARGETRGAPTRIPVNKHPISLEFADVRVDEVMSILATFDGRRLVVDPSVADHRIACHYRNMPWDAAVADIAARGNVDISYDDRQITVKKR